MGSTTMTTATTATATTTTTTTTTTTKTTPAVAAVAAETTTLATATAGNPGSAEFGTGAKEKLTESQRNIQKFWPGVMREMQQVTNVEPGNQVLPLARIKKIMKLDDEVKMISSDAPLLFAKAIEIFIHELTLRAWLHTEHNKRRTLQRSDIAMAITKYDQFDFLIDIVPREEIKVCKKEFDVKTIGGAVGAGGSGTTGEGDVQYYLQLAQTHHQALQYTNKLTTTTASNGATVLELTATPITANQSQQQSGTQEQQLVAISSETHVSTAQPVQGTIQTASGQNIIFSSAGTVTSTVSASSSGASQTTPATQLVSTNQPLQLLQHVLTPAGEITQIPISIPQNQLNFIRTAGGTGTNASSNAQPIFIQANAMGNGPTIIHTTPAGVFLSTNQLQQIQQQQQKQQQQQQQQQHSTPSTQQQRRD